MWYDEYRELVDTVIRAAHKFYSLRYQMSDGGNMSVRVPGTNLMIVKGTNISFEEVSPETLVLTDFDGNIAGGNIRPSKEALLHSAIYRCRADAGAVMHCHSVYATAWAAKHNSLTFSTYHSKLKFGGEVRVFDTRSYAVPRSCFPEITEWLSGNSENSAFLLRGHGQVTIAGDMRKAAYLAELLEETAAISVLSENGC